MPRKTREKSKARISDGLQARIMRLSKLVWASNRTQMARDVGTDQSTVSKVLAGKQEPSARFLEGLATCSRVNAVWLFTGQGEPLIQGGTHAASGLFRPLLDELLPGPPKEHRSQLT